MLNQNNSRCPPFDQFWIVLLLIVQIKFNGFKSHYPPFAFIGILQHFISMFLGSLSVPYVLGPAICLGGDGVAMSELIGTLGFVSGLVTLAQLFIGIR